MSNPGTGLRELLIETISQSGYAHRETGPDTLVKDATFIGVLPEILREARARHRERLAEQGIDSDPHKGISDQTKYYSIEIGMPPEMVVIWQDYLRKRGTESSSLIRSVIHEYLQRDYEPSASGVSWKINGILYRGDPKYQKAGITYAARTALQLRAASQKLKSAQLLRSLLVETIHGEINRPGELAYVQRTQMFADPGQYYFPENALCPLNMNIATNKASERLIESYGEE